MAGRRTLIKDGIVVSMDDTIGDLRKGDILVEGTKIKRVEPSIDEHADEVIDASNMIVMPGLIDTHIHLWQMPLRGFSNWYQHSTQYMSHIYPRRAQFTAEDVYAGVYAGALEAISNGTTTVLDFCHCINSLPHGERAVDALRDAGIRGVHGHSFSRSPFIQRASYQERFADADRVRQDVVGNDNGGLLTMMIALDERQHGVDLQTFKDEIEYARKRGMLMTMHSNYELHMTVFNQHGLLGPDMMPCHGIQMTRAELDLLAGHNMPLSFCPTCEYKRDACIMLGEAAERNVRLVWGVDVPTLIDPDLFAQMNLVVQMQQHLDAMEDKIAGRGPRRQSRLSSRQVLKGGTIDGAKSVGLGDRIGSLTPGKEADILLLQLPFAGTVTGDLPGHILYQSGARDVDTVMIAGKLMKRNGKMLTVDREHVRKLVSDTLTRVMGLPFEPRLEWSLPHADWRSLAQ